MYYFGKSEEYMDLSRIYLAVPRNLHKSPSFGKKLFIGKKHPRILPDGILSKNTVLFVLFVYLRR